MLMYTRRHDICERDEMLESGVPSRRLVSAGKIARRGRRDEMGDETRDSTLGRDDEEDEALVEMMTAYYRRRMFREWSEMSLAVDDMLGT